MNEREIKKNTSGKSKITIAERGVFFVSNPNNFTSST